MTELRTGAAAEALIHLSSAAAVVPELIWIQVAATYDGVDAALFVDGVELARQAAPGELTYPDYAAPLDLGIGNQSGRLRPFAGLIDDLRVYSVALAPEELAALWEATR